VQWAGLIKKGLIYGFIPISILMGASFDASYGGPFTIPGHGNIAPILVVIPSECKVAASILAAPFSTSLALSRDQKPKENADGD
jgi:hypothetical protein